MLISMKRLETEDSFGGNVLKYRMVVLQLFRSWLQKYVCSSGSVSDPVSLTVWLVV